MGKDKRKSRLNKGESGEFIGFGAFAAPTPAPVSAETSAPSTTSTSKSSSLTLSPVYMGSDSTLTVLFPRIGQKRDATTKTKALQELRDYLASEEYPKKSQVDALTHFLYLYHSKLHYDVTPKVRASSLECCEQAATRLPKAWNTLCNQQSELYGMIYCHRADPAADVRLAATQLVETLEGAIGNDTDLLATMQEGVWDYVQRVLSYGKPIHMHEELFQRKDSSSTNSGSLSDRQKEELEERYERIVRTTLGGLQLYIQQKDSKHTLEPPKDENGNQDVRFIWKTLTSSKAPLRRTTYELLSTCCQKAPHLVNRDKLSKLLSQNLSSEKERTNVTVLLQTLLSFVAHVPTEERTNTISLYARPLAKLFQRGCHGATLWMPTVLPIVALLPPDEQPNVLTSVWQGKSHIVGVADQLQLVAAVAETATYLLLLEKPHDMAEVLAKCWFHALHTYLTTTNATTGPAKKSHADLGKTLARDLQQMDRAVTNKPSSSMAQLETWFWNDELPKAVLESNVDNANLAALLKVLPKPGDSSADGTETHYANLNTALKQKFFQLLQHCGGASGLVPTLDVYQVWTATFQRIQPNRLFDDSAQQSMDNFVMNDVLRWMVIHTSSLSEQSNDVLAKQDFELFRYCRPHTQSPTLWDALLRELITAKCDLELLAVGLTELASEDHGVELVRSPQLDELCRLVAREAVEPHEEEDEEDSNATELRLVYHQKLSHLLQTSTGLGEVDQFLVDKSVLSDWLLCACPKDPLAHREHNPVLETLVLLVKNEDVISQQDVNRVFLQAWRQGGDLWDDVVAPWLQKHNEHLVALHGMASRELQGMSRQANSEAKVNVHVTLLWSNRAFRLLNLLQSVESDSSVPVPSLSVLGLDDVELWRQGAVKLGSESFVALCLLEVLGQTETEQERWNLFVRCDAEDPNYLLVQILTSLSAGNSEVLVADVVRRRQDQCAALLSKLRGQGTERTLIHDWIRLSISSLATDLQQGVPADRVCQGIAVLSQLVELLFPPVRPSPGASDADKLQLDQITKGSIVWYVPNAEQPAVRERCTVVKVHNDLPQEVYFTIKLERNGVTQERQTVGERLRSGPVEENEKDEGCSRGTGSIRLESIDETDSAERNKLMEVILRELVLPNWDTWVQHEYELLHIVISQLGAFGKRGIGSMHFTLFQKLNALQGTLVQQLGDLDAHCNAVISTLWQLSYAMGFGGNTPASPWDLELLGFDPTSSASAIVHVLYEESIDKYRTNKALRRAAAAWLSVCLSGVKADDTRDSIFSLLFLQATDLFENANTECNGFAGDDYMALRAVHSVHQASSCEINTEAEALLGLVKSFVARWEDAASGGPSDWCSLPLARSVMEACLKHRTRLMAVASRKNANELSKALFVESKRLLAVQLLRAYASEGVPIHDDPEQSMNDATSLKLKEWSRGLMQDEAEELEEDVEVVGQWVPKTTMNEIEGWRDITDGGIVDHHVASGRLLSWLSFLQIVDIAASKDSMNRLALTSYVSKCEAVNFILTFATSNANIGTDRKVKLESVRPVVEILETGDDLSRLARLAALVIFRTVEVFPTSSKHWWEMECPNYFTQTIRDFVESTVSPEILRRELERIKATTSFGDMTVKGSAVSREVTALYVQDDFTLSVVIKMPLSFPFRRAEVDCSKTLGVPEGRWKRWALQITQMLNNQGGTLKDALVLWKENVDKEFEGVEPCPVCYSVLHVKTHKLPEMECKTCHNRFHFDCLTQWFRSSGKNACVICQQPWSGTRV